MIEDERINAIIKENPEFLENFTREHGAILAELRARFETFIADGNMIFRYLMSKALFETLQIQAEVLKQHLQQQIRERDLNIVDVEGKTEH